MERTAYSLATSPGNGDGVLCMCVSWLVVGLAISPGVFVLCVYRWSGWVVTAYSLAISPDNDGVLCVCVCVLVGGRVGDQPL